MNTLIKLFQDIFKARYEALVRILIFVLIWHFGYVTAFCIDNNIRLSKIIGLWVTSSLMIVSFSFIVIALQNKLISRNDN